MTDYNRFISYLFYYSGGIKVSAGHARIEVRQGMCKISIHIKKDGIIDSELDVFYYIREAETGIKRVKIGNISIKDGAGNAIFENDVRDINKSNISFSEVNGVIIYLNEYKEVSDNNLNYIVSDMPTAVDIPEAKSSINYLTIPNGYIAADWEEVELSPSQVMYNYDKPVTIADTKSTTNYQIVPEIMNKKEEIAKNEEIVKKEEIAKKEEIVKNEEIAKKEEIVKKEEIAKKEEMAKNEEAAIKKEMTIKEEIAKKDIVLNESEFDEISLEEDYDEGVIINEDTDFEDTLLAEEKSSIAAAETKAKGKIIKTNLTSVNIGEGNKTVENNYFGKKMPWQDAVEAREILDGNERMYPFQDREITECVKIEPKDIGRLPVEFWVLGNNSFLLHSYCNYKYLLFAKRMNRVKCEYLLMVPGVYQHREKVMAKMFGFEHFKCIRCREHRIGEFGYWYMSITF